MTSNAHRISAKDWQRLRITFDRLFMPEDAGNTHPVSTRMFVVITLVMIALFTPLVTLVWQPPLRLLGSAVIAAAAVMLFFNRAGYTRTAAFAFSVMISLLPAVFVLTEFSTSTSITHVAVCLMWIPPAHMVTILLLSPHTSLFVMGMTLISVMLIGVTIPDSRDDVFSILNLTVASDLLLMLSSVMSTRYITRISAQAQELAANEQRFRMLLNASSELIVIHQDGVIIDVNHTAQSITGYTLAEVIGRRVTDFVEPRYQDEVRDAYTHDRDCYESILVKKSGEQRRVEVRASTQLYQGSPVRVAVIRDITEQRDRQTQEFALAVEREKVKTLQKFISDISHDLRTPLSVINTSIYLVGKLSQQPEKQQRQIDMLRAQTTTMQRMLEDLINMSRLDRADTSDFSFRWMNITLPLREAIAEQHSLALRKNQKLTLEAPDDLPDVLIDRDQVKRAVKHLILNGLNYTGEGGAVSVVVAQEGNQVLVRVRDTGAGISAKAMPFIFDYFYRADDARGGGGIGLGLTIAKKIIEAHKGSIEASSEIGIGSVFTIRLPARQAVFETS